jgi:hypothetical protein
MNKSNNMPGDRSDPRNNNHGRNMAARGSVPKANPIRQSFPVRGRGPAQPNNRQVGRPPSGASQTRPPRGQVGVAAAYATGQRSAPPSIQASRDQSRIVHRELIGSMTGSAAFAIAQSIPLNPGMATFAPWLATQAQSWERYRFNRLRFCYYTRTGSNVPGSMMLVPDYDAADAAPVSEQVASSYEDVEEDAPWKDICCVCKPSSLHALGPSKFIRSGALAANQDIKTYDAGNLFACTVDGTAVSWGKLWVEYDVTLLTPQLNPAGGGPLAALHITSANPTTASMLGTQVVGANSTPFATVAGNVVTFSQAGRYSFLYSISATTATQTGLPVFSAGSANIATTTGGASLIESGSGTTDLVQAGIVSMLVGGTITFNDTIVTGAGADLIIAQMPSNVV